MWKNEGRHVKELRRIDFCKNKAVVVPNADIPSDENIGQLVHFVGKVSVDDDAIEFHPGALNVTAPLPKALVIKRTCMIYQKFEQAQSQVKNDRIGAGQTTTTTYTVNEDWTMQPQAERLEHLPGETNSRGIWDELVSYSGTPESASLANLPPNMPPQLATLFQQVDLTKAPHALTISRVAHVGEFSLSKDVITTEQTVFQSEWMPLPAELVPYEIESLPELRKDRYGEFVLRSTFWIGLDWIDMGRWMDALNSPCRQCGFSLRWFSCYYFSFSGGSCFSVNIDVSMLGLVCVLLSRYFIRLLSSLCLR